MAAVKQFSQAFMKKFNQHNVTLLAASLAYYFLLAIFPLLIVGFAIIPYFQISPDDAMDFLAQLCLANWFLSWKKISSVS